MLSVSTPKKRPSILKTIPTTKKGDTDKLKKSFYVLDVETKRLEATKEAFVFGCIYGHDFHKFFYSIDELEIELNKKRYSGKYIFAHNGEFDFTCLFGNIIKMDNEAIFNGSRFVFARYGKCKLADSMNLLLASVGKIGKDLGMEKLENEHIFEQLAQGIITKEAEYYCKRDCEIIYTALSILFDYIGAIKITLASSAMYLFRKKYLKEPIFYDKEINDEFFESYYGGRCEAFKLGKVYAHKSDINSMYPFAMTQTLIPNPSKLRMVTSHLDYYKRHYFENSKYEGLMEATIFHPKRKFGLLPFRKGGKLVFPSGEFRGTWNFNELRYAISRGVEIREIHKIIYAPAIENPCKNYALDHYEKRLKSTGFWNYLFKIFNNSLYGKFGQRNRGKSIYFENYPFDKIEELKKSGIKFTIELLNPFTREDGFLIFDKSEEKELEHSIPLIASYITSFSRIYLLEKMEELDPNYSVVYCDTDSICTEIEIPENSMELGKLKLEKEVITEIRGLKDYSEITPNSGELPKKKIKGIPKKAVEISENSWEFTKLLKTKESLRRNLQAGISIIAKKEKKGIYEKRKMLDEGKTEILEI